MVVRGLVSLLIFPGALFAVPMGWFMVWLQRRLNARLQGRIGPPFYQPFFDFIKLLAKERVTRSRLQGLVLTALPVLAVGATLGVLALLPVFPEHAKFSGDLVLLVGLIEVIPLAAVLAGFASRSLYGGLGATREALLGLMYNLPFLAALGALSVGAGSFSLSEIALKPMWAVRIPALIALALCIPVKLHMNPFSIANAEQEIYAGATTEYGGPRLAIWELAHDMEWVAVTGLWASLAFPVPHVALVVRLLVFVAISLALVVLLSIVGAATARLKLAQAARVFWQWGFGIGLIAFIIAVLAR